jgi:hypothetical protein
MLLQLLICEINAELLKTALMLKSNQNDVPKTLKLVA